MGCPKCFTRMELTFGWEGWVFMCGSCGTKLVPEEPLANDPKPPEGGLWAKHPRAPTGVSAAPAPVP